MANCNQGNSTLDPYQSIIDVINKGAKTLENQAAIIQPLITEFDGIVSAISSPTPSSQVLLALNQLTADAICASSTNLQPLNDLTSDCLNEANAAVKRYLKNILGNIADGVDLITDIVTLPEGALFTLFQQIWAAADNIKDLITALDNKIQCITLSPDAATYQDQIDDLNIRLNDVTDSLRLESDGSFDSDTFLTGIDSDLKANIQSYETKSTTLKDEIETNISNAVGSGNTVNPKRYF